MTAISPITKRMRGSCSAINCNNNKWDFPNLAFFRFPKDVKRQVYLYIFIK